MGHNERSEKNVDRKGEASGDSAEVLQETAQTGMEDLTRAGKSRVEQLKHGGNSGVTRDFGKPVLENATQPQQRALVPIKPEESEAQTVKPARRREHEPRPAATVDKDADDRVTGALYSSGLRVDVHYGPDGKISDFKFGTDTWTTEDGRHWTVRSNGKEKRVEGTASIASDGTLQFSSDLKKQTFKPDGSSDTVFSDGSKLHTNADGTRVLTNADGKVAEAYYANGQKLTVIRGQGDPIVARWNVGDDSPDHYVLDTRIKGKSDIDPDGTAHISDETGTYTMKLDGTIGRQVNLDKEGRVSEVYYPNGDKLSVINGFGPPIIARWTRVEGAPPGVYNLVGRIPGKASVTRDGTLTVEDANGKHITTIDGRTEHRK